MLFIFILLLLIYLFFVVTYTKTQIAQWYGISKPTLRKWVRYFCPKTDYQAWKSKRKFSGWEVFALEQELGCPDSGGCLTKGQIKEQCETEYETVTGMIELNAAKVGISVSTYRSVDIFPPLFSKRIVSMMG